MKFAYRLRPILASIALLSGGCDLYAKSEVARFTSPDKVVDAVLVTVETDATSSTPTELYIIPAGGKLEGEPFLTADHIEDVKLEWAAPKILIVSMSLGRVFHFNNFWQSRKVDNFNYTVQIYLHDARSPG